MYSMMSNRVHITTGVENLGAAPGAGKGAPEPLQRRVLRDISQNEPPLIRSKAQAHTHEDKKIVSTSSIVTTRPQTRSYKHVQAKVNSGLPTKISINHNDVPLKPLKREESTNVLTSKPRAVTSINVLQNKISTISLKNSINNSKESKQSTQVVQQVSVKVTSNGSIKLSETRKLREVKIVSDIKEKKKENSLGQAKKSSAYSSELLDGVQDIDEGQEKNPMLVSIYVKDIYLYLREVETMFPIKTHYLDQHEHMTPKMRTMLIDWLVQVHNQFSLLIETLHLTVAIIDRYLQTKPDISRMQIQLVGITAMFIASKYEEMFPPDISDYSYITDNTYSKKHIIKCEKAILKKLDFQLGRPLPIHFVRRFIKAANESQREHVLAKYLVDLCLVDYQFVHYKPSKLAAAAVCLSVTLLAKDSTPKDCWTENLCFYSGYSFASISNTVKKIATLLCSVSSSRFKAVTAKYNSTSNMSVASFPELANAAKLSK